MTHKAGTAGTVWNGGKVDSQVLRWVATVVLSALAVALVVASIYVVLPAPRLQDGAGVAEGLRRARRGGPP